MKLCLQLAAIRLAYQALKDEIREYIREKTNEAEQYMSELMTCQTQVEDIQREIVIALKETPTAEMISCSGDQQQRTKQAIQMNLKGFYLEERVLAVAGIMQ